MPTASNDSLATLGLTAVARPGMLLNASFKAARKLVKAKGMNLPADPERD